MQTAFIVVLVALIFSNPSLLLLCWIQHSAGICVSRKCCRWIVSLTSLSWDNNSVTRSANDRRLQSFPSRRAPRLCRIPLLLCHCTLQRCSPAFVSPLPRSQFESFCSSGRCSYFVDLVWQEFGPPRLGAWIAGGSWPGRSSLPRCASQPLSGPENVDMVARSSDDVALRVSRIKPCHYISVVWECCSLVWTSQANRRSGRSWQRRPCGRNLCGRLPMRAFVSPTTPWFLGARSRLAAFRD